MNVDRFGVHEDDWGEIELVAIGDGKLVDRKITVDAVAALVPRARRAGVLWSGYGTPLSERVDNGFAFLCSSEDYWDTLYGTVDRDGHVTQLAFTPCTAAVADVLATLGRELSVTLYDHRLDVGVDLADPAALRDYLCLDDD